MVSQPTAPKFVGARVKRREDPRLITGHGTYVDDIQRMHGLHMALKRSELAHSRIVRIDTEAAKAIPGVVAVFTAADLEGMMPPLPAIPVTPDTKLAPRLPLTGDKVRHVGDAVAVVVAENRYIAADAVAAIEVEYDELPVVVDLEAAMQTDAPRIHDQFDDNVAYYWVVKSGEIDEAFANAAVTVKEKLGCQRLMAVPLETRVSLAEWQEGEGKLTFWCSTQMPHVLKPMLAGLLGLPEHHVRVVAPEVGGGFGVKGGVYNEDWLACMLARRLGKPVKYVETRQEDFQATGHGRGQLGEIELAATRDGLVTGLRAKILGDMGAYTESFTAPVPTSSGLMITGVYTIPAVQAEIYGVYTNKTQTGAYRGAGRPEAAYYIERMMDLLAAELGLDPVEVRRRNLIPADAFPYTTATGNVYDSGNYAPALEKALSLVGYDELRRQQRAGPRDGKYLGVGISTWTEVCGYGPPGALPIGGWEFSQVTVERGGAVTVLTGASPHGQGQETTFAQIVADELGVPIESIRVLHGDTDVVPHGVGTFGSRGAVVGGVAVVQAAQQVREKIKRWAAHLMDASEDDLELGDGKVWVKGSPDRSIPLADVAGAAYSMMTAPPDTEPGLQASSYFQPQSFTYPFGAHAAVVEVDAETGGVELKQYVAVDDCGTVLSPLLVAGQVHGGVAQGIGQALFEEVVYDENGQLISGSLMDYGLPHAENFPRFELTHTVTPSPHNPLGVKGIGEAGTIAATPTVVSAVLYALKPFGVRHLETPLRPEKLWRAMQG